MDRFQPLDHRYASLPYHYVLDELGAMVVAAGRGGDPDTSRWRADKALAIGKSERLRHLVGVSGFFSALVAESRRRDDCGLSLSWSERHCASQFDRIAEPDGLGVWEEAGDRVVFCLAHDCSTETFGDTLGRPRQPGYWGGRRAQPGRTIPGSRRDRWPAMFSLRVRPIGIDAGCQFQEPPELRPHHLWARPFAAGPSCSRGARRRSEAS